MQTHLHFMAAVPFHIYSSLPVIIFTAQMCFTELRVNDQELHRSRYCWFLSVKWNPVRMGCCESPVPAFVAWEGVTLTPGCSRTDLSCTSGVAVAPVLGWIRMDLWSTGRAAVNCSGLFYAGTSQNCNLRVWYALLFLLMERKWFKFLFKMCISYFSFC